tara:strand:- start:334 stop:696 length:363 start_codon:yes stop_codon:yes gene_type:complete
MGFRSGTTLPLNRKVAASAIDLASASSVTSNGPIGSIDITLDGGLANGAIIEFTLTNSFIETNSTIITCVSLKGTTFWNGLGRSFTYNVADGSCKIFFQNNSGGTIADDKVIYVSWEVLN